jgi:hypothetical protein
MGNSNLENQIMNLSVEIKGIVSNADAMFQSIDQLIATQPPATQPALTSTLYLNQLVYLITQLQAAQADLARYNAQEWKDTQVSTLTDLTGILTSLPTADVSIDINGTPYVWTSGPNVYVYGNVLLASNDADRTNKFKRVWNDSGVRDTFIHVADQLQAVYFYDDSDVELLHVDSNLNRQNLTALQAAFRGWIDPIEV